MPSITPETVARHELVGLHATVVAAANPDLVGIEGRIIDETTNTLRVAGADRVRTVPKAGATLALTLPDGRHVTVDGSRLVARPARRTERTGGSPWRSA